MPDAPGTELLAQDLREAHGDDAVLGTEHFRGKGAINVAPDRDRRRSWRPCAARASST